VESHKFPQHHTPLADPRHDDEEQTQHCHGERAFRAQPGDSFASLESTPVGDNTGPSRDVTFGP